MDTNTIDAMCNILLVVIGIIGLLLVRREGTRRTAIRGMKEAGRPSESNPA